VDDLKIILVFVVGNGAVLSVFYYAFIQKIKEIAKTENKEIASQLSDFENKHELRLMSMEDRLNDNREKLSNHEIKIRMLENTDSEIKQMFNKIDNRINEILNYLAKGKQ
jgi:hypothetical protein